eukprot:PhF_6_TR40463/c0_g1_i1/m.60464/K10884/XRCC6, KU70, G22P1; ATP-dependent DNA helicase 2 subunit 1
MDWKPFDFGGGMGGDPFRSGGGDDVDKSGGGGGDGSTSYTPYHNDRDAVLFLIDCQKSMFEVTTTTQEDGTSTTTTSPFCNALRCVIEFMHDKVFASSKDLVGVIFYATEQKLNHFDFPGIYVFHSLDMPSATRIQELEIVASCCKVKSQYDEFVKAVGHCPKNFSLSEVLWASLHTFHHLSVKNVGYRRIFIFTDDENPPKTDTVERNKCFTRARDLVEANIMLEVFAFRQGSEMKPEVKGEAVPRSPPKYTTTNTTTSGGGGGVVSAQHSSSLLSTLLGPSADVKPSPPALQIADTTKGAVAVGGGGGGGAMDLDGFNSAIFWDHVVYTPEDSYSGSVHVNSAITFKTLLSDVKRKLFTKRAVAAFNIRMGPSRNAPLLSVQMYNPLIKSSAPSYTWLEASTNAPLVQEMKKVCRATGAELGPTDVVRVAEIGGAQLPFTQSELTGLTTQFGPAELTILQFVTKGWLKVKYNVGHASFLHPNESSGIGSTKTFTALLRTLLAQNKIAIAQCVPRNNAAPRLVALVPSEEKMDMDGTQTQPAGLWLINLPYADDYRALAKDPCVKPEDDLLQKAKRVIRRLTSEFPRDSVPNPSLQWHYAVLQQLAVGDECPDSMQPEDLTRPDLEGMMKYQDVLKEFASEFPSGYNAEGVAGVTAWDPAAKKARVDLSGVDFHALYKADRLDSLTLPFLKQFLKDRDASVDGVKKSIVERVKAILAKEVMK